MSDRRIGPRRSLWLAGLAMASCTAIAAAAVGKPEQAADCSRESIIHYAAEAPGSFEKDRSGLLYGIETHTPATRVGDNPGLFSCALVTYAILKRAGCSWVKYTANAKTIFDMAAKNGWRRSPRQEGGCMVAWNSPLQGGRERIARESEPGGGRQGTRFRHVGITTGGWMSVDNSSALARPTRFFTWRPWRYEWPIFLCPPQKTASAQG
jgi:hypothetical protein